MANLEFKLDLAKVTLSPGFSVRSLFRIKREEKIEGEILNFPPHQTVWRMQSKIKITESGAGRIRSTWSWSISFTTCVYTLVSSELFTWGLISSVWILPILSHASQH